MNNRADVRSRESINCELTQIYEDIGKEDSKILHQKLDEIFQYKPTDNYYTYVRCALYLEEKNYDRVLECYSEVENWYLPDPYALLLIQIQYRMNKETNNIHEETKTKIVAYYTYCEGTTGINTGRIQLMDTDFLNSAKKCYEEELAKEAELYENYNESCLSQIELLDQWFWIEYTLLNSLLCTLLVIRIRNIDKIRSDTYYNYWNQITRMEPNSGFLFRELEVQKLSKWILFVDEYLNENIQKLVTDILDSQEKEYLIIDLNPSNVKWKEELDLALITLPFYDVIASRNAFSIVEKTKFGEKIECLSEYKGRIHNDEICFGYIGKYTQYLSRLYEHDYEAELNKKDEYLFSIIIPARNSAYTLQYTLNTVLSQRNIDENEYEIVISDNSSEGNHDIKQMVDQYHNPHIHYYKTPRELPLHKSFEYAYGKARGTYILSLGSDDGLLPWALETLKQMLEKYPEQNVISWERGFFQWTESDSLQKGKFVIPRKYTKGSYAEHLLSGSDTLANLIENDGTTIYSAPVGYINSVFKRSFFKDLMSDDKRGLDGYTQDVCMALKSLLINQDYLQLEYPLSIAGMANGSLGQRMAFETTDETALKNKVQSETVRGVGNTIIDSIFPFWVISSTEGMFWTELFRIAMFPEFQSKLMSFIQKHDFQKTFIRLTGGRSRNSLDYILLLEKLRCNAYVLNPDLGKWFEEVVYKAATETLHKEVPEEHRKKMNEQNQLGGMTLDAAEYEVITIEDAVRLFTKITKL